MTNEALERFNRIVKAQERKTDEAIKRYGKAVQRELLEALVVEIVNDIGIDEYYRIIYEPLTRIEKRFGLDTYD